MRKLFVILCIAATACSLAGCGGNTEVSESQAQSASENITEDTDENTDKNADKNTDDADMDIDVSDGWSDEMQQIKAAIVEVLGEDYWPDTPITPDMLEGSFGISSDMYDDYLAEMPMISANVDTLLIIKAKDDKVEEVGNALNEYRDALVENTMQYPMNLGKIQASRIERFGNYVCFVQLGAGAVSSEDKTEDEIISECREINELVLAVINNNIPD
ncbi:MAG: DUF4358 domain-containing protein [Lachnospiraceae bacterium]|nr:DUF4358 domain-containing protein [Lachnospiraceae bacterium]